VSFAVDMFASQGKFKACQNRFLGWKPQLKVAAVIDAHVDWLVVCEGMVEDVVAHLGRKTAQRRGVHGRHWRIKRPVCMELYRPRAGAGNHSISIAVVLQWCEQRAAFVPPSGSVVERW